MVKDLIKETENHMKMTIEATKKEFQSIRTGRANAGVLDRVQVEYYGNLSPLNQVASVTIPDPRTIVIQPWDKSLLATIEKAILKADLGMNPVNDGTVIRLPVPQLTEERRKDLVRVVRKEAEEKRVVIRNLRRDANDKIKNEFCTKNNIPLIRIPYISTDIKADLAKALQSMKIPSQACPEIGRAHV